MMSGNNPFGPLILPFAGVGAVFSVYFTLKLAVFLLRSIKMFGLGFGANVKRFGEWAVVTGATDGIGKAYAEELAKRGLNIVLISRTLQKLETVAQEIESKFKVKTKVIVADFTQGAEIYEGIGKELKGLEVGVLVNNVGMSYSYPTFFLEVPDADKFLPNLLNINCLSVTMMTYLILPSMVQRKKGLIMNVSSASGMNPSPLLAVYSATKAYMDFFSRCLQTEYSSKGIIVQSVLPFFVTTKLSKIRRSSLTVPTPNQFAKSALATVGNEMRTNGCFSHNVQGAVVDVVPEWLLNKVQMAMHLPLRARMLKKLQEQGKKN